MLGLIFPGLLLNTHELDRSTHLVQKAPCPFDLYIQLSLVAKPQACVEILEQPVSVPTQLSFS